MSYFGYISLSRSNDLHLLLGGILWDKELYGNADGSNSYFRYNPLSM